MIAPREGRILTSTDPNYPYMHGSPWDYDTRIPLIFYGAPFVRPGRYADVVSQQAVAPTIARLLKLPMPVTTTGPVLDRALASDAPAPRMVLVAVLDGARSDYLERHAASLPNLSRLRREGAEFDGARVDYLPTATAVAHATVATGTDPRVHGIVVNLGFDTMTGQERDPFRPDEVPPIMVPTLADLWNINTGGRAVIAAQGSLYYAPAALAGHGACMSNARPVIMAAYSQTTGGWVTNPDCFRLPAYLASMSAQKRVGECWRRVAGTRHSELQRGSAHGALRAIRNRRAHRPHRARAVWCRRCGRSAAGQSQDAGFRRAQVRSRLAGTGRDDGRARPPDRARSRGGRSQSGEGALSGGDHRRSRHAGRAAARWAHHRPGARSTSSISASIRASNDWCSSTSRRTARSSSIESG